MLNRLACIALLFAGCSTSSTGLQTDGSVTARRGPTEGEDGAALVEDAQVGPDLAPAGQPDAVRVPDVVPVLEDVGKRDGTPDVVALGPDVVQRADALSPDLSNASRSFGIVERIDLGAVPIWSKAKVVVPVTPISSIKVSCEANSSAELSADSDLTTCQSNVAQDSPCVWVFYFKPTSGGARKIPVTCWNSAISPPDVAITYVVATVP